MSWQHRGGDLPQTVTGQTVTLASDGDRDAAARVLGEAFAQGRLTADEHGERVRATYAARTWDELAQLTADLPDPADAAGRAVADSPDGLDRCLLCALLIACPPAGIAWLLTSRRRSRTGQRHDLTAASEPSFSGRAEVRNVDARRAEDR